VSCRALRFAHKEVCQQLASALQARKEKNASAVLRGIVREHIGPRRAELTAAAREREADARLREKRDQNAAKQRQFRTHFEKDAAADAIELFLSEFGERYKGRAVGRLNRDAAALANLGLRVVGQFADVMNAKERHNPLAMREKRQFAEDLARRLGYALAPQSQRAH